MFKYNTEYIKQIRPLQDELTKYGVKTDKRGFAHCPFHDEKTASFKVYNNGTYYCFGCGANGDVISFTMRINNVGFEEACAILDGDIKYSQMRRAERIRSEKINLKERLHEARKRFWGAFDEWQLNEVIFKSLRPKFPYIEASEMWLKSLSMRSYLLHKVECAENELTQLRRKEEIS